MPSPPTETEDRSPSSGRRLFPVPGTSNLQDGRGTGPATGSRSRHEKASVAAPHRGGPTVIGPQPASRASRPSAGISLEPVLGAAAAAGLVSATTAGTSIIASVSHRSTRSHPDYSCRRRAGQRSLRRAPDRCISRDRACPRLTLLWPSRAVDRPGAGARDRMAHSWVLTRLFWKVSIRTNRSFQEGPVVSRSIGRRNRELARDEQSSPRRRSALAGAAVLVSATDRLAGPGDQARRRRGPLGPACAERQRGVGLAPILAALQPIRTGRQATYRTWAPVAGRLQSQARVATQTGAQISTPGVSAPGNVAFRSAHTMMPGGRATENRGPGARTASAPGDHPPLQAGESEHAAAQAGACSSVNNMHAALLRLFMKLGGPADSVAQFRPCRWVWWREPISPPALQARPGCRP